MIKLQLYLTCWSNCEAQEDGRREATEATEDSRLWFICSVCPLDWGW